MAVRYVLDTGVALKMLSQEPHLRSVIKAERYVDQLKSPDAMTKAMSDVLLATSAAAGPGDLLVIDFNNIDFTLHSGVRNRSWSAQWEAHGELFVF